MVLVRKSQVEYLRGRHILTPFIVHNIQITPVRYRDLCSFLDDGYGSEPTNHPDVGPA